MCHRLQRNPVEVVFFARFNAPLEPMMKRIYRMKDLCQTYGMSRSTIYRLMESGHFPKPVKIGIKAVGWDSEDLDAWYSTRRLEAA